MARKPQLEMLKKQKNSYGGELRNTREGRKGPRPLAVRSTIHLVLRSSKARGPWAFNRAHNELKIKKIMDKFSVRYGVRILSMANVGNHLHFHIQLVNRFTFKPFIRAVTSAIAIAVTGANRWSKVRLEGKFWDYRPFTRVIQSFKALLNLRDYIQINQLEGFGVDRREARWMVKDAKRSPWKYNTC